MYFENICFWDCFLLCDCKSRTTVFITIISFTCNTFVQQNFFQWYWAKQILSPLCLSKFNFCSFFHYTFSWKKYHPQKPWPISSTSIRIHWKTISFCNLGFLFSLLLQVWVHPSHYFLESAGQQSNACIQTSPYTCKMHFIFIVIFSIRMLRTCQKRGQVLQF